MCVSTRQTVTGLGGELICRAPSAPWPENGRVGELMRYRAPELKGLSTTFGWGVCLAVARNASVTALGVA